tara:strand:+ start:1335 stop:1769 length:435 start_codon:yes stop_codon:yes gene_type:complete
MPHCNSKRSKRSKRSSRRSKRRLRGGSSSVREKISNYNKIIIPIRLTLLCLSIYVLYNKRVIIKENFNDSLIKFIIGFTYFFMGIQIIGIFNNLRIDEKIYRSNKIIKQMIDNGPLTGILIFFYIMHSFHIILLFNIEGIIKTD